MARNGIEFDCTCVVEVLNDSQGNPKDISFLDRCDHHCEFGTPAFLGMVVQSLYDSSQKIKERDATYKIVKEDRDLTIEALRAEIKRHKSGFWDQMAKEYGERVGEESERRFAHARATIAERDATIADMMSKNRSIDGLSDLHQDTIKERGKTITRLRKEKYSLLQDTMTELEASAAMVEQEGLGFDLGWEGER